MTPAVVVVLTTIGGGAGDETIPPLALLRLVLRLLSSPVLFARAVVVLFGSCEWFSASFFDVHLFFTGVSLRLALALWLLTASALLHFQAL